MSVSYFCSPFFLLKARFIVEKCASPRSLLSIWQYSTWKSSREKRVKNVFDLKRSRKTAESLKTNMSSSSARKKKKRRLPTHWDWGNVYLSECVQIKVPVHLHPICLPPGHDALIMCGGCNSNLVGFDNDTLTVLTVLQHSTCLRTVSSIKGE